VSDATTAEDVPLISAPEGRLVASLTCWLLAVQLYGVRSARNWGMGDFTDLASLIELADHLGADGVGLNPLHALFDDRPGDCSPYSPNSRLFLNALYIDVERLPEFQPDSKQARRWRRWGGRCRRFVGVAGLKWRALRRACRFQG
jgi:4-alpha-glucanotransferase